MKSPRYILALILLICSIGVAQAQHYQFSHDSVGNRTSRVYQGTVTGTDAKVAPALSEVTGIDSSSVISTGHSEWRDPNGLHGGADTAAFVSNKDTSMQGPLVKTAAQKAAYLDSMLAEAVALEPFAVPILRMMQCLGTSMVTLSKVNILGRCTCCWLEFLVLLAKGRK